MSPEPMQAPPGSAAAAAAEDWPLVQVNAGTHGGCTHRHIKIKGEVAMWKDRVHISHFRVVVSNEHKCVCVCVGGLYYQPNNKANCKIISYHLGNLCFLALEVGIYPALLVQHNPFVISVQFSSILFISPQQPPQGVFIF